MYNTDVLHMYYKCINNTDMSSDIIYVYETGARCA